MCDVKHLTNKPYDCCSTWLSDDVTSPHLLPIFRKLLKYLSGPYFSGCGYYCFAAVLDFAVVMRFRLETCDWWIDWCGLDQNSQGLKQSGWRIRSRKFIYHNQNFNTLFWRFDLIISSSSEEAGTQFFRVLMRRSAVVSSCLLYTSPSPRD